MKVKFVDSGREPQCKPNPAFPHGMYVDLSKGAVRSCEVRLPYPAPRCGAMTVECEKCGVHAAVTVAGRSDDPHTVKVACRLN